MTGNQGPGILITGDRQQRQSGQHDHPQLDLWQRRHRDRSRRRGVGSADRRRVDVERSRRPRQRRQRADQLPGHRERDGQRKLADRDGVVRSEDHHRVLRGPVGDTRAARSSRSLDEGGSERSRFDDEQLRARTDQRRQSGQRYDGPLSIRDPAAAGASGWQRADRDGHRSGRHRAAPRSSAAQRR